MTSLTEHSHHEHHDGPSTNRLKWAKAAILLGLGGYFVYILASGNVTNYINARFIWLSYLAGGLFALYGGYIVLNLVQARQGHAFEHEHDHDHAHDHASWGILAVVAVPILIGFGSASTPLGADAVNGGVSLNPVGGEDGMVVSSDDPSQWHVLDWLRAYRTSDDPTMLDGEIANVVGFIYREPGYPPDTAMVTRFTVNCCVADASAIGLPVRGESIAALEQGTWVRVSGPIAMGEFNNGQAPVITPQQVELAEIPDPPYIYP